MATALPAPLFEIGPKNYLRRGELLELCAAAREAGARERVTTIVTLPAAAIEAAKRSLPDLIVFAQHMDPDGLGASVGRVIAEALVEAGADGVMLNHSQHPLTYDEAAEAVERARTNSLRTLVCAADSSEALLLAALEPDLLLVEPPSLIGRAGASARPSIPEINSLVADLHNNVMVMHAGGIATPADAGRVILEGALGTGVTSAIVKAADRAAAIDSFLSAVRSSWDARTQPLLANDGSSQRLPKDGNS